MKIIFIDADGTLLHHEGYIPKSALNACLSAQNNGHKIILCTGRQRIEVYGDMLKLDYDGMITGSGAHVEVNGEVLQENTFSSEQLDILVHYLDQHDIDALYEMSAGLIGTLHTQNVLEEMVHQQCGHLSNEQYDKHGLVQVLHNLRVVDKIQGHPVNKISFLSSLSPYEKIEDDLKDQFDVVPATFEPFGQGSGEISNKTITKATGMQCILDHFHADIQDSIAIGDGFNDICMFEKAVISVAMGNADPEVQKQATFVTTSLNDDGILKAFIKLKLISDPNI